MTTAPATGELDDPAHRPSSSPGRAYARAGAVGGAGALVAFVVVLLNGHRSLLRRALITSDFYDVQAHSLLDLRWDVPRRSLFLEGFFVDGKVYEYFGPVPAILRMPIAAFTDSLDGRLGGISMVLALVVALVGVVLLAWQLRGVVRGDAPVTRSESVAVAVMTLVAGAGSVLIFLASRTYVFHEAAIWGAALTLVAFERVIAATRAPTPRAIVLASFFATLAVLTRASVGLGPVVALGCLAVAALWPTTRRLLGIGGDRSRTWLTVALLVAVAVPLVLFAYVNYAKFGSLFSVPFDKQGLARFSVNHQRALAANGDNMFGLRYVPTTLWSYLRPDGIGFSSLLPWVTFPTHPGVLGDAVFAFRLPTVSVPSSMPFLTGLSFVAFVGLVRPRSNAGLTVLRAPVIGAAVASVTTFAFAYVADRYLADFLPILVVLAIAGLQLVLRWSATATRPARRVVWTAIGVLAAVSIWFNVGIAVLHARWVEPGTSRSELAAFVELRYRVHALVPGGPPPDVQQGPTLPEQADDGTLFILGDCDALYARHGTTWRVLERGPGAGSFPLRVRFPESPSRLPLPLVVAGTDAPSIVTAQVLPGDRVVFAFNGFYASKPVPITPGREYDVDVVVDPNRQRVSVALDGRKMISMSVPNAYFDRRLPPLGDVTVGENRVSPGVAREFDGRLELRPTSMSLCRFVADDR